MRTAIRSALQSTRPSLKCAIALVALLVAFAAAPSVLYAQSCAMCYQNAAAAGPRTAEALRHGILIMLFPPLFIFAGIIVLAHRRSNDTADSGEDAGTSDPSLFDDSTGDDRS
jgi:hypothetical protein